MLKKICILMTVFILLGMAVPFTTPAHAQSDEVLARVDQAMTHLSDYLDRTITRESHFWQWAERVWNNQAMECGVPGETYDNEVTRGYRIRITVDEVEYDYRIKSDGSILILCIDNLPDPSSANFDTSGLGDAPAPVSPPVIENKPLPAGTDWALFGNRTLDTLYLMNPDGVQAQFPRPTLNNEAASDIQGPQVAASRDGKYLIVTAPKANGRLGLGIYSLADGAFVQTYEAEANEGFYLYDTRLRSNPAGTRFAVGLATLEPSVQEWRILVFDLATGDPVAELAHDDPAIEASGYDPEFGTFFPSVIYYDDEGTVHFQLIRWFSEGVYEYDTLAWNPDTNAITLSPYTRSDADIAPETGLTVFTDRDETYPVLPETGPFRSENVVAVGLPDSSSQVWIDGTHYHSGARWAAGTGLILFRTSDQSGNPATWHVLEADSGTKSDLSPEIRQVAGTENGFWSISADNTIAFHTEAAPTVGSPVWTGENEMTVVWTLSDGTTLGLESIALATIPTGPTFCPGAPPSIVAAGIRARVTTTDENPLPLRLREAPGGTQIDSIDEGTEFSIIGGPECLDGYTWWNIRLADGTTGWSAEGSSSNYFMEPVSTE